MSVLIYLVRIGVCLGVVLLNVGIIMWFIAKINSSGNASRFAVEVIKAAIMLVAVAVIVYIW